MIFFARSCAVRIQRLQPHQCCETKERKPTMMVSKVFFYCLSHCCFFSNSNTIVTRTNDICEKRLFDVVSTFVTFVRMLLLWCCVDVLENWLLKKYRCKQCRMCCFFVAAAIKHIFITDFFSRWDRQQVIESSLVFEF